MMGFTPIQEKFIFKWDSDSELWYKRLPNNDTDHLKFMKELSAKLCSFLSQYKVKLAFFEQRVQSIEDKLTSNERVIKTHFLHYQNKLDQLHQGCFTQYSNLLEEHSMHLQQCYNEGLEQIAMDLRNKHLEAITMALTKALDKFNVQLQDDQQHHIKTITDV
jgi:hypothetical protein